MKEFDKNFHINFSPLYFAIVVMLGMLIAFETKASEIEEVIVVAQQEKETKADPVEDESIIGIVMPAFTYPQGGPGGFVGYAERGAQTIHTSVFVNGIPANDPGAGWYDFGHDIAHGQTVKVISGSNSVIYGSGSMAGTVLIQDTIEHGLTLKRGNDDYIRFAPVEQLEVSSYKGSIGSVRNDNDEKDEYVNKTARLNVDVGDFIIVGKFSEYEYDYDNCYDYNWGQSNDCLQDGKRYNIAIRNNYFTVGRNYNNADYTTAQDPTYSNESFRDYMRVGNQSELSKNLTIAYGVDAERQTYNTISTNSFGSTELNYEDENFGGFINVNASFIMDYNFGIRVGNDDQNAMRLGIEKGSWFFNVGNSFRKANLYEKFGDGWVDGNEDLLPEEGIGYEVGYGVLSVFRYEFEETIEYQSGYTTTNIITPATYDEDGNILTEAVTEDVYTNATYVNGGDYITQGIRFSNNFGPFMLSLKYTDTEQARIPKYVGLIQWEQMFNGVKFNVKYAVNLDRAPSQYDFLPEGQEYLDDLKKLDFTVVKEFTNGVVLALKGTNLTDEVVEVTPYYNTQGRQFNLALNYKW